MGHEGAGMVIAVGPQVSSIEVGDSVMLNWAIPCYTCFQCQEGNQHLCEKNSAVTAGNSISGGHATVESTTWNGAPVARSFSLGTMSEYSRLCENDGSNALPISGHCRLWRNDGLWLGDQRRQG
jgi:S-(hydroxymethyl)glutathione dehydrogenase/alcohol dehydrogenase